MTQMLNEMKKIIVLTLVTASAAAALAQTSTNTSSAAIAPPPKPKWQSSVSLGLTLTRGNSDTTLSTVKLLTSWKDAVDELAFGTDAAYGESGGVKNTESLHGFGQWNRLFDQNFYSYLRAEGLHDGISDVKYRALVGPGIGNYLLKQTNTSLAVEAGGSELFQRLGTNDTSFGALRLADRFEHRFAGYGARVWQRIEFLPEADNFENYIVNAEAGVEASIAKHLSLQTYVDDTYANEPAAGHLKNDVKLVSGIAYRF